MIMMCPNSLKPVMIMKSLAVAGTVLLSPFLTTTAYSEIIPLTGNVTYKMSNQVRDLAPATDIFLVEKDVRATVKLNRNTGTLSFSIISPYNTQVKVVWDDKKIGYKGNVADYYDLYSHTPRLFSFTTYDLTSGTFYVYNVNDELLLTIPYEVVSQSKYRKNLSINTRTSFSDINPTGSISFSMSEVKTSTHDGTWTYRTTINGINADESLTFSASYSW